MAAVPTDRRERNRSARSSSTSTSSRWRRSPPVDGVDLGVAADGQEPGDGLPRRRPRETSRRTGSTRTSRSSAEPARRPRRAGGVRAAAVVGRAADRARERAFWSQRRAGADDIVDMVVPRASISGVHGRGRRARRGERGPSSSGCGHAGDGNVHLSVFQPDPAVRHETLIEMFAAGMALGGAISGEHGIGVDKKAVLARARGPGQARIDAADQGRVRPRRNLEPGHDVRLTGGGMPMKGAQALLGALVGLRGGHVLREPRHVRDALRRGARRRSREMRGVLALFEGVCHRRRGRLRPHGGPARGDPAPPRSRVWATGSPTSTTPDGPTRRSSTSSATTPPITSSTTRRSSGTSTPSHATSRRSSAGRPKLPRSHADAAATVAAAFGPPGQVATLVLAGGHLVGRRR